MSKVVSPEMDALIADLLRGDEGGNGTAPTRLTLEDLFARQIRIQKAQALIEYGRLKIEDERLELDKKRYAIEFNNSQRLMDLVEGATPYQAQLMQATKDGWQNTSLAILQGANVTAGAVHDGARNDWKALMLPPFSTLGGGALISLCT